LSTSLVAQIWGPPAPTGKFVYNLYTNWQANMSSDRLDCRLNHIPCGPDLWPACPDWKIWCPLGTKLGSKYVK
ncbi:MAG: hypothetical protein MUC60_00215, partial [Oscillatoria sp. Prado101]|nr:hypothetical protein [Oscillatoria sp. Prado101]